MTTKDNLIEMIKVRCLKIKPPGEFFTLKSGKQSRYYLDARRITLSSDGLEIIVNLITNKWMISGIEKIDAIGGPSIGADPIVGGLLYFLGHPVPSDAMRGFLIRPEAKDHGVTGTRLIGSVKEGDRCLLIEDVITTGETSFDSIRVLEDYGCKVVAVIAVINRSGDTVKNGFDFLDIPFYSLVTLSDLGLEGMD